MDGCGEGKMALKISFVQSCKHTQATEGNAAFIEYFQQVNTKGMYG